MSLTYGFYNSANGDRKYDAEDFNSLFDGILEDGVFSNVGELFAVESMVVGNMVAIHTGKAWFDKTWTTNDTPFPIDCGNPELTLNRIDAVVLEINKSPASRENAFKVVKGAPSNTPKKPILTKNDTITQYPLAYITRRFGASYINQVDIENAVGTKETPFATGIMQTADIGVLLEQWNASFLAWFETVKGQLSGDVAGNLQLQIDELEENIDKKLIDTYKVGEKISFYNNREYDSWGGSGDFSIDLEKIGLDPDKYIENKAQMLMLSEYPDFKQYLINNGVSTKNFSRAKESAQKGVFAGDRFIIIKPDGFYYSFDGISFIRQPSDIEIQVSDLKTQNDTLYEKSCIFYVCGNTCYFSIDKGRTVTEHTYYPDDISEVAVVFANDQWYIITKGLTHVASTDAFGRPTSWTHTPNGIAAQIRSACYGQEHFVVVGTDNIIRKSRDCYSFEAVPAISAEYISYGHGLFFIIHTPESAGVIPYIDRPAYSEVKSMNYSTNVRAEFSKFSKKGNFFYFHYFEISSSADDGNIVIFDLNTGDVLDLQYSTNASEDGTSFMTDDGDRILFNNGDDTFIYGDFFDIRVADEDYNTHIKIKE